MKIFVVKGSQNYNLVIYFALIEISENILCSILVWVHWGSFETKGIYDFSCPGYKWTPAYKGDGKCKDDLFLGWTSE